MIRDHIQRQILTHFPYEPTESQKYFVRRCADFLVSGSQDEIFLVKGYAGTGKTTIIASLVNVLKQLGIGFVLLAPTGRAAKVLTQYSGLPASTIHKKIYRQNSTPAGLGNFVLDRNLHTNTLFIVDEASMIGEESSEGSLFGSGNLLNDLISYVYGGEKCRLLLIGDTAQLPPVGADVSPAFIPEVLKSQGLEVTSVELTEVIRQEAGSGILVNATCLREMLDRGELHTPEIVTEGYSDIRRIAPAEVPEFISSAYGEVGIEDTIVVCRSNKLSNRYNAGIRRQILAREEELSAGDYMMVVKNNYFWLAGNETTSFIANGDVLKIRRIKRYEDLYGFKFAEVTAVFPDYGNLEADLKLLLDTIGIDAPSLPREKHKELIQAILEDYASAGTKRRQLEALKTDPYFNALQVKFAYAVTCHKAQGGQWHTVFVDPGRPKETSDREFLRWLYTALTRATSRVYFIDYELGRSG